MMVGGNAEAVVMLRDGLETRKYETIDGGDVGERHEERKDGGMHSLANWQEEIVDEDVLETREEKMAKEGH